MWSECHIRDPLEFRRLFILSFVLQRGQDGSQDISLFEERNYQGRRLAHGLAAQKLAVSVCSHLWLQVTHLPRRSSCLPMTSLASSGNLVLVWMLRTELLKTFKARQWSPGQKSPVNNAALKTICLNTARGCLAVLKGVVFGLRGLPKDTLRSANSWPCPGQVKKRMCVSVEVWRAPGQLLSRTGHRRPCPCVRDIPRAQKADYPLSSSLRGTQGSTNPRGCLSHLLAGQVTGFTWASSDGQV